MLLGIKVLEEINSIHHCQRRLLVLKITVVILVIVTLACGFAGRASQPISDRATGLTSLPTLTRTRLPTFTPTTSSDLNSIANAAEPLDVTPTLVPVPVNTGPVQVASDANPAPSAALASTPMGVSEPDTASDTAAISSTAPPSTSIDASTATTTATPTAVATETPQPTDTPTPEPTSTSTATATAEPKINTPGWAIAGIQLLTDQSENRMMVYGDLINNTGSAQKLSLITGTFRDVEGQVMTNAESVIDVWPIDVVPSGAQMPFELTILGLQSVASFDLSVEAEPSSQSMRQDFDFLDIDQWVEESGDYCIAGNVRNPDGALQEFLLVVATLYDDQDNVINFGQEGGPPPSMVGDDSLPFVICGQNLNQHVARYELRAWGR